MTDSSAKRNMSLDAIAGLFILLMMFQHFNINTRATYSLGHIFMFNTSWFFFKSGMFHKPSRLSVMLLIKWIKRLIVPFAIFSVVGCLTEMIVHGKDYDLIKAVYGMFAQIAKYGAPWWNIPVWFILTMFFVKIITIRYEGGLSSTIILSVLFIAVAFVHHHVLFDTYNYIGNTALAALFYIIGYKATQIKVPNPIYIILIGISVISIYLHPTALDIWGNRPIYGNYLFGILAALSGMLIVNKLFETSRFLAIKPLVFVGQNAMLFLVCHVPIALAVREILENHSTLKHTSVMWVEAAVSISFCLLLCFWFDSHKKYRWIIGG